MSMTYILISFLGFILAAKATCKFTTSYGVQLRRLTALLIISSLSCDKLFLWDGFIRRFSSQKSLSRIRESICPINRVSFLFTTRCCLPHLLKSLWTLGATQSLDDPYTTLTTSLIYSLVGLLSRNHNPNLLIWLLPSQTFRFKCSYGLFDSIIVIYSLAYVDGFIYLCHWSIRSSTKRTVVNLWWLQNTGEHIRHC